MGFGTKTATWLGAVQGARLWKVIGPCGAALDKTTNNAADNILSLTRLRSIEGSAGAPKISPESSKRIPILGLRLVFPHRLRTHAGWFDILLMRYSIESRICNDDIHIWLRAIVGRWDATCRSLGNLKQNLWGPWNWSGLSRDPVQISEPMINQLWDDM